MQSKTSLFNHAIFRNILRRYWVVWVGYAAVSLLAFVLPIFNMLQAYTRYPAPEWQNITVMQVLENAKYSTLIALMVCGVVAAVVFSYLYNSRQTGLMTSLPVRRETMFLSVLAAAFAGLFAGDVLTVLGILGAEALFGHVNVQPVLIFFAILVMSKVLFLGFASFCCMLTGQILGGPAVYAIFNFTAVGVEGATRYLLHKIVYGMGSDLVLVTQPLSPLVMLMDKLQISTTYSQEGRTIVAWEMEGLGVLGVYCAVGVVFAVLALLLYRRRHMEMAGDAVAVRALVPVFKVLACLAGALILATICHALLLDMAWYGTRLLVFLIFTMVLGGTVGWFIAQMLVEKSFRVFDHGWKSLAVMWLIFAVVLTAAEYDWTGYERRVPQASDVEKVWVRCSYRGGVELKEAENMEAAQMLHRNVIAHRAQHEQAEADGETMLFELTYTLKTGRTLSRSYRVDCAAENFPDMDSDLRAMEALWNTNEAIALRWVHPDVTAAEVEHGSIQFYNTETGAYDQLYTLSNADYAELYSACMVPDMLDGNLGQDFLVPDDGYAKRVYECDVYLMLRVPPDALEDTDDVNAYTAQWAYVDISMPVTTSAVRTCRWLTEHGVQLNTVYEVAEQSGDGMYTRYGWVRQTSAGGAAVDHTR